MKKEERIKTIGQLRRFGNLWKYEFRKTLLKQNRVIFKQNFFGVEGKYFRKAIKFIR